MRLKHFLSVKRFIKLLLCLICFSSTGIAFGGEVGEELFSPDLPILTSNASIEADIITVLNKFLDSHLGTSSPSSSSLTNAVQQYNNLNISVSGETISGNTVSSYTSIPFLKTFAQHLRYNPNDQDILDKANKAVWLVTSQVYDGSLKIDGNCYSFRSFAVNATSLYPYLDENVRNLVDYTMNAHKAFNHYWVPSYDAAYQENNGTINTDVMYNLGTSILAFAANQVDADQRYLWMRGYKRWLERFTSCTFGTADGIKVDGTGFHHWTAYDGYMYSLQSACKVTYFTAETQFQIEPENYFVLRDAIYAEIVLSNDSGVKALSMVGRNPHGRGISYSNEGVKLLAIAGGKILNLITADPVLAGEHNRIWGGAMGDLNYTSTTPLSESDGYYQFNHANAGVFRKDKWVAVMKGFTNGMWGSELYATSNRYGRYQSYGTLEVLYPGSIVLGNGYDYDTWNWNYNPGATTIVLPWAMLHGEKARIDEYQKYDFAGALAFKLKDGDVLNKTHGTHGIFAMNFNEVENQGFSTVYGPNTHNSTFRFKKSTFVMDDMIICLGSDINNDDTENNTVTTLFQRLDNTGLNLFLNGRSQRVTGSASMESDNWMLSNYNTGFYIFGGNDMLEMWNGTQQTPNRDQIDPEAYINNSTADYWLGYLDHGSNPVDAEYEYIVIPNSTRTEMIAFETSITAEGKPYTVHEKSSDAHIVENNNGIWGYAIFSENTSISNSGVVSNVNEPCLIMYEEESNDSIYISVCNPGMSFSPRSFKASVPKVVNVTLKGHWNIVGSTPTDVIVSHEDDNTVLSITTDEGMPVEFEMAKDISNEIIKKHPQAYRVYPNPAKKIINVDGEFPLTTMWEIVNLNGAVVKKGELRDNTIDTSSISKGLFLLSLKNENSILFTQKISIAN